MSIIIPHELPAAIALRGEGIEVAPRRPGALRVALLNLMPDKIRTETQFARCLSQGDRSVELVLTRLRTHRPRRQFEHVDRFYEDVHDVLRRGADALIVTGAPVEAMPFEYVAYWEELSELMALAPGLVPRRLYICWGAQAALFAQHGVPKHRLDAKAFGVFEQRVLRPDLELTAGLGLRVPVPVSRHTETRTEDLDPAVITVLASSRETGPGLAQSHDGRDVYSFNHFEYDATALWDEYRRDLHAGSAIARPRGYFRNDDPALGPDMRWAGASSRFFANWLDGVARDAAGGIAVPRLPNPARHAPGTGTRERGHAPAC